MPSDMYLLAGLDGESKSTRGTEGGNKTIDWNPPLAQHQPRCINPKHCKSALYTTHVHCPHGARPSVAAVLRSAASKPLPANRVGNKRWQHCNSEAI